MKQSLGTFFVFNESGSVLDIIKKVPIPTAGVALGLAALGNLLQPYSETFHHLCGALALLLIIALVAKIALFPDMIKADFQNSILASVSATAFMATMQIATYLAPFAYLPALILWWTAVASHFILMTWFSVRFIGKFNLKETFPTYFICYVGIIVASVTAPTFGLELIGHTLFWFGFACYMVLLVLITYRYFKHEIPEPARPLFCIYAAPMSLSLTGYLATAENPNLTFAAGMLICAQIFLVIVLAQLPHFLRLPFYPSYAAMTFPFVITATALGKSIALFEANGAVTSPILTTILDVAFLAETSLATALVFYVFCRYIHFLASSSSAINLR